MTGRFPRRILELRGVSAATLKNHPKLDDLDEFCNLGLNDDTEVDFSSRRTSVASDAFSYSTNCSSVSSLDDDEFEKESAQTVQHLFDDIDSILYGDTLLDEVQTSLQEECWQWTDQYPYLRILGKQLASEEERGYETIQMDPEKSVGESHGAEVNLLSDEKLVIDGKQMDIYIPMVTNNTENKIPKTALLEAEHEEIILQEGEYEELIAVDDSDEYKSNCLRSEGAETDIYQQIPPQKINSITDELCDLLTNKIWNEVASWMRPLFVEFANHVQTETPKISAQTAPPLLPSNLASKTILQPSMRLATAPPRSSVKDEFHGLLTISSKPLQYRHDKNNLTSRKFDSGIMKPLYSDNGASEMSTRKRVTLRRIPTAVRLTPLEHSTKIPLDEIKSEDWLSNSNFQRPKTAKQPNARIPSSYWTRHVQLPPIQHPDGHNCPIPKPGENKLKKLHPRPSKPEPVHKESEFETSSWIKSSTSIHLSQIEEGDVASLKDQWEIMQRKELDELNDEPIHTVEPFVSWLLSQVQSNACRAGSIAKSMNTKKTDESSS